MSDVQQIDTGNPDGSNWGKAATNKLAMYGGTPTVQCSTIAATTDSTTVIAGFNTFLTWAKSVGMIASA